MFAVLLTTLTGTILFVIWYGIARLLEYLGFINIIYEMMKGVLPFWLFPLSYIILKTDRMWFDKWGGFLFEYTPFNYWASIVFCTVWFAGATLFLAKYIFDNWRISRRYRMGVCADSFKMKCFEDACRELKLDSKRFRLVECANSGISKIFGIGKPTIVIPDTRLDEEEYRVIFIHELTHYKQKVVWLKHLTVIALSLNFMNPTIWIFDRKVQEWGEYACDHESIKRIGSMKGYFTILLNLAIGGRQYSGLQANLVERKGDLESRILKMKRSYKIMNNKKKWMAVLAVAVMMVTSTVSVSAATITAGNAYVSLYNASVVEKRNAVAEEVGEQNMVLHYADALDEGYTEEVGEVEAPANYSTRAVWGLNWDIAKNMSKRTDYFDVTGGKKIAISVNISPSDAVVRAGIIKPDGSREYVEGHGSFMYIFDAATTGKYSVYVQNVSGVAIHVDGAYYITQ